MDILTRFLCLLRYSSLFGCHGNLLLCNLLIPSSQSFFISLPNKHNLRTPQFNGENYDFWSVKMRTIFRAYDLWDVVEGCDTLKGVSNESDSGEASGSKDKKTESVVSAVETKEKRIKDAKALSIIQGALTDDIFPRIRNEETARGAWNLTKFFGVINDLKSLGEEITRELSIVSELEGIVMLRITRAHN